MNKNVKKIICLTLVAVFVCSVFVGCSRNKIDNETKVETNTKNTTVVDESTSKVETITEAVIPASVEWRDCKIMLSGKEITLPCSYADIAETGWKIPDKNMGTYFPENHIWYILAEKDGTHDIGLTLVNTSGKECSYDKCIVAGVKVFKNINDDYDFSDVVFPGNITVNKTYETLDDAYTVYGTPDIEIGKNLACKCFWGKTDKITFDNVSTDGTVYDTNSKGFMRMIYETSRINGISVKEMQIDISKELVG